ncbi:hypothetical protein AYI68_g4976, partial [Smittium mucronatum]
SYPNVGFIDMAFLQIAVRRWDPSDCRTLDLCTRLCLSCVKRSVHPVSRWSSSGIVVFQIAVRCLHYSQPRILAMGLLATYGVGIKMVMPKKADTKVAPVVTASSDDELKFINDYIKEAEAADAAAASKH